ncbi:MAG: plastocyanin [Halothece sp.]
MKPIQTILTLLLAVTLLLGGCASSSEAKSPDNQTAPTEETTQTEETTEPVVEEATDSDTEETAQVEEATEEDVAASETEEVTANVEEQASATGGETYQVKMGTDTGQLAYVPETLTIAPGDTVEFVMNKLAPHNVVFESNGVPSGAKALASSLSQNKLLSTAGETHTVTFPKDAPKGEYKYYCQPHRGAGMKGKIIIE